ncbi:YxlC family protein [Paenibacillus sp. strain BS8-2]
MMDDRERGDKQWFRENIGNQLERMDEVLTSQQPELHVMEAFVADRKHELKRKFRRELVLFWLLAAVVLGAMAWTIDQSLALFVTLQITVTLLAGGFMAVTILRLMRAKGKKLWKNS